MNPFSLFPVEASSEARSTDLIFFGLIGFSLVVILAVLGFVVSFAIRYRRNSAAARGALPQWLEHGIEIGWTLAATFLFVLAALWTAATRLAVLAPPSDAMEIHVVAKQWMWKAQHANGVREINALHVPLGAAVRLSMTSEDVIHSFFAPELRVKQDVLPGRSTRLWFKAVRTGEFHLFCAQLCGTSHARMTGEIIVMAPADFSAWLASQPRDQNLAAEGRALFASLGCGACHDQGSTIRAPKLAGRFGAKVALADGAAAALDDAFIRDIVLHPGAHAVAGYDAIMPSYAGLVGDDELSRLSAYIRSLASPEAVPGAVP